MYTLKMRCKLLQLLENSELAIVPKLPSNAIF